MPARGCGPGEPDIGELARRRAAAAPQPDPQAACLVGYCDLWAHPGSSLCYTHRRRWIQHAMPDLADFARACETPPDAGRERADLTGLPDRLRLEVQYALQCRRDDNMIKTRPTTIRSVIGWLAGSGCSSLLDRSEQDWRAACPAGSAASSRPRC